ncbi:MAG: tetratricopeptide repeat protein [Planctomycetes bacterium]|nr:tetratricopeptide repeat protein [Planctomycetota bacterium]
MVCMRFRVRAGGANARAATAVLVFGCASLAQQPAGDPAVEFARLWEQITRDPAVAPRLAPVAVTAFLRIADAGARFACLERAVAVRCLAGQAEAAIGLAAEARQAGIEGPILVEYELRALAQAGRLADFAAATRAAAPGQPAAMLAAVRAEEGRILMLADAALRTGQTADAVHAFELFVQAWPGDAVRLANLALTRRHLGDVRGAAAAYEQALAAAPDDPQIRSDHGLFLRATGDWPGALAALQTALAKEAVPGEGPAITNLVQMAVLAPDRMAMDVLPAASRALSVRPDAVFLRRVTLDLILDRSAIGSKQPFGKSASTR